MDFLSVVFAHKRFKPDRTWRVAIVMMFMAAELICFAGYLGGYFDREPGGPLQWHAFQWDVETIAYTVGLWLIWLCSIIVVRYNKDPWVIWGARFMLTLPVVLFLIFATGGLELGPS